MNEEEQWRQDIIEAHPYAGSGLELDDIIVRGQGRARRKRNARRGASIVGVLMLLGCGGLLIHRISANARPTSLQTIGQPNGGDSGLSTTTATTSRSTTTTTSSVPAVIVLPPTSPPPTTAAIPKPDAPPTTAGTSKAASGSLPITVQSDAEMKAAGNNGPSSSILDPTSCTVSGTNVTASGGYTNGGFAPNVYNRYGAVVRLYVYTSPVAGYPQGRQIVDVSAESAAPIGGYGPWEVTAPIYVTTSVPARCVVASQPTHDLVLAP